MTTMRSGGSIYSGAGSAGGEGRATQLMTGHPPPAAPFRSFTCAVQLLSVERHVTREKLVASILTFSSEPDQKV